MFPGDPAKTGFQKLVGLKARILAAAEGVGDVVNDDERRLKFLASGVKPFQERLMLPYGAPALKTR